MQLQVGSNEICKMEELYDFYDSQDIDIFDRDSWAINENADELSNQGGNFINNWIQ